ncbi:two-component system response regulator [Phaeobacter sp. 22II1-1F12B]|uniref:response regulator n=1 Tax=Phaeobacter sp. 22II1-1F12B TaxID=1317111 RepID=UPI001303DC37|nr:response regulator [Phaeobacter sp. 22II1-1F12B]
MNAESNVDSTFQEKLSRRARLQEELRVLAVDDDHNILQLLKTALSAFHFNISISDSGANALKLIERQEKPFDCFLLDIQMPNMNGIMLCKEIRKLPAYRQSPILMLTAMSDREYVDLAFVAGATDYVTKPFDFLELRSRMSAAQRLVQERRIAETAHSRTKAASKPKFPLSEPVSIEGIDRILRYTEFDNYIMQLSQGRMFNTHAAAVKIANVEDMHERLSVDAFETVLRDVALAMANQTKKTGDIISYRGDGVFLMVRHSRFSGNGQDLEDDLNKMLHTLQAQRQGANEASVITGDSVSLRSLSKSGSLMSINRAIESVNMRDQIMREEQNTPRRLYSGPNAASEPETVRKRQYQNVLQELFRDEPSLRND